MPTTKSEVIRPLHDLVVIRPIEAPTATPGGIALPDVVRKKPTRGTVLAVGPGIHTDAGFKPTTLRIGDVVLFGQHMGHEDDTTGEKLRIIHEENILGKLIE